VGASVNKFSPVPCVLQTAASGGYATGRISLLGGETRYAGQWLELCYDYFK